jgi:GT2 family glycosyltransferase
MISVIIPVYNSKYTISRCIDAVLSSDYPDYECIILDDSSSDGSIDIIKEKAVRVVELKDGPHGPAYARNHGAEVASGDILLFIDADVIIQPDTLTKVVSLLSSNPSAVAVFGSYDNNPGDSGFLSQYKNLIHHFVHQTAREDASTFWSGCGAIHKETFQKMGGFDDKRFTRPSIEDIDLGYRLKAEGYHILLCKELQVTHLKPWSLIGLLKTDILNRAIPWAKLILQYQNLPNDLNVSISQRISTVLLLGIIVYMSISLTVSNILLLLLIVSLFFSMATNWIWDEGKTSFFLGKNGDKSTYFLMGIISLMALYTGMPKVITPLIVLLPVLLFDRILNKNNLVRQILFLVTSCLIILELILLLASFPLVILAPPLLLLMVIIVINNRLYSFLVRSRGLMFALASLPLQLLYYLYSVFAFLAGSCMFIWNTRIKSRSSNQPR